MAKIIRIVPGKASGNLRIAKIVFAIRSGIAKASIKTADFLFAFFHISGLLSDSELLTPKKIILLYSHPKNCV